MNAFRIIGRMLGSAAIGGMVVFVLVSANMSWQGRQFDLGEATTFAAMFAVMFGLMSATDRWLGSMPLFRRNADTIRDRRKDLENEREQMRHEAELRRAAHRLENKD
ncbi:MAG: hypothetical protein AAGH71_00915 [Planctomycetota bacterium]